MESGVLFIAYIVGIYTQSLDQICEIKRYLQADHVKQDKIGVFKPAFRFFSVHYFFLPSLIQPQHPPPKLESDSAAVFLESLIFFACLLLSYILTNKSRTIFAKIQQSL